MCDRRTDFLAQFHADDPVAAVGCRDGHLLAEFVTLVSFAFAETHHVRFVKAVELLAVGLFLGVQTFAKAEQFFQSFVRIGTPEMFLKKLDDLGIADNTIVFYSTDNGVHMNTGPDAGMTPFPSEKNTNWEGGWRVPAMVCWLGKIEAGSVSNEIMHHMDWLPTFLAAAGDDKIKQNLLTGHRANGREYKIYLDGYNFLPYLTGKEAKGPRDDIFYFSDTGDLTALRYKDWKLIFLEQRAEATMQAWIEPWIPLRIPDIINLRRDPYERAMVTSNTYYDWLIDRAFLLVPAQQYVAKFLETFKEYPPRQKAGSFTIDQLMEKLKTGPGSKSLHVTLHASCCLERRGADCAPESQCSPFSIDGE